MTDTINIKSTVCPCCDGSNKVEQYPVTEIWTDFKCGTCGYGWGVAKKTPIGRSGPVLSASELRAETLQCDIEEVVDSFKSFARWNPDHVEECLRQLQYVMEREDVR